MKTSPPLPPAEPTKLALWELPHVQYEFTKGLFKKMLLFLFVSYITHWMVAVLFVSITLFFDVSGCISRWLEDIPVVGNLLRAVFASIEKCCSLYFCCFGCIVFIPVILTAVSMAAVIYLKLSTSCYSTESCMAFLRSAGQ